jgi:hypothetical protein
MISQVPSSTVTWRLCRTLLVSSLLGLFVYLYIYLRMRLTCSLLRLLQE